MRSGSSSLEVAQRSRSNVGRRRRRLQIAQLRSTLGNPVSSQVVNAVSYWYNPRVRNISNLWAVSSRFCARFRLIRSNVRKHRGAHAALGESEHDGHLRQPGDGPCVGEQGTNIKLFHILFISTTIDAHKHSH